MNQDQELNNSLKLIFKSFVFILVGFIFAKFLGYLYRIIIARYFGPEVYGLFSLATIILFWFVAIASLGFSEGILRHVAFYRGTKSTDKIRYIFKFSLIFLLITGLFSGLTLFSLSEFISINIFHNADLIIFLKLLSFLIPIYIVSNIFLYVILAYERVKFYSILTDVVYNTAKLVSLIVLVLIGIKTNSVIFSFMLGTIVIFIVSYFYSKYKITLIFGKVKLEKKEKNKIRNELFLYSWPLIFSPIFYNLFPYISSFFIGYFKNVSEVGLYNSAVPIAELMLIAPFLFERLFFPLITKEFSKKNFEVITELSKQVQKWILLINIPFLLLILVFPDVFISILFGSEYLPALNALRFLAIGFIFYTLSIVSYNLIAMAGKSRIILIDIILISMFNIILNIIFIPKYGIAGAAIATMISHMILLLFYFFQVNYYTSIFPIRRKMIWIIFSALIPAIILLYLKNFIVINLLTFILQVFFLISLYILLIFMTKSLDKNDLMILNSFKEKLLSYRTINPKSN